MMPVISQILLIMSLVLQIVLLIHLFFVSIKRHKEDKKYWKKQEEISDEVLKHIRLENANYNKLEEGNKNENR